MSHEEVSFGGMASREFDERVSFEKAITASDCYVDRDGITARNGYRSACATSIGTGLPQGVWRWRPRAGIAFTVTAIGGLIYVHADPSSEVLSDATKTNIAPPSPTVDFGATDKVSGAQLGKHFYLGSDGGFSLRRLVETSGTVTMEDLKAFTKAAEPGHSLGTLAWFAYRAKVTAGAASTAVSGCAISTTVTGLLSDWYGVVGTTGDTTQPSSGATVTVTLTTAQDVTGADWLAVGVSPPDSGIRGKEVAIEISSDASAWYPVGKITDTPLAGGSPNLIFGSLAAVPSAVKAAFKYVKFTITNINDATTLRYAIYGHLVLYNRQVPQPVLYYVTFQKTSTLEESPLSPAHSVQINTTDVSIPRYTDQFMSSDSFASSSAQLQPLDAANNRRFNTGPSLEAVGVPITISGTTPNFTGPDKVRLWKQTSTGIRLVTTVAYPGATSAYSLVDNGSLATLSNDLHQAQGTAIAVNAMSARASRLALAGAGSEGHKQQFSSFLATNAASSIATVTDPKPQFPDIATEEAHGWSFFIAPSNAEQIQDEVNGDALYVLTNENVYSMNDVSPNSPPFRVFDRGALGRRCSAFVENVLVWASYDGIYLSRNRSGATELTEDIRRYYRETFAPDSTTVLGYQARKLYAFCGTRYIRYDFVTGRWTSGTLAHTVVDAVGWRDPGGTIEHMWLLLSNRYLVRWQPADVVGEANKASSDLMVNAAAGTAIPDWIYSTGYAATQNKTRVKFLFADVSGAAISLYAHKDANSEPSARKEFSVGESEMTGWANFDAYKMRLRLTGPNSASVRRLLWEREALAGRGA